MFLAVALLFVTVTAMAQPPMGVLFVGGYASGVDPTQRRLFEKQKEVLDRLGIPYRDVAIRSTRPFEESVPSLERAMRDAPWDRYMVVSHSMGGVIALDALIADTALQKRLAGWVAYNTPFYGASRIDRANRVVDLWDPFRVRQLFDWTGMGRSANRMSGEERRPYMRRNDEAIRALTATGRVTCVTSDIGFGDDRLVDTDSMRLPAAHVEHVGGASHTALVVGGKGEAETQALVFMRALRPVLERRRCDLRDLLR